MKRVINAASRSPKTKNIYIVCEAMGWNIPTHKYPTPYGYKCKWGGYNFIHRDVQEFAAKELALEYGVDPKSLDDDDPLYSLEHIVNPDLRIDNYLQWLRSGEGKELNARFRELASDPEIIEQAKQIALDEIEEVYERTGIRCKLNSGNFLVIPYGEEEIVKRVIRAATGPWKTKYEVHWVSPDGEDYLLAGNNDIHRANKSACEQAWSIFENPFETNERKLHFLDTLYIVEVGTEDDAMTTDTEDYIDSLMSELDSRIRRK